jgi:hypothetical protein
MTKQKPLIPLPLTYKDGRKWNLALLKSLSNDELRSLIRKHGASALNNAIATQ